MRIAQLAKRWNLPPWEVERAAADPALARWFITEAAVEEFEAAIARGQGG